MKIETIEREFSYNGMTLADPNPSMSVAQVQATHAAQFPELATAKPKIETRHIAGGGERQVVTFHVSAGTKG
jgi:PRTRC genetic system protein C